MSELDFDATETPKEKTPAAPAASPVNVLRFDLRALQVSVLSRWKLILGVFFVCVIVLGAIFKYRSTFATSAWTAEAKVFHQLRSERVPAFYKPMDTQTVYQFITGRDVFRNAARKLGSEAVADLNNVVEISMGRPRPNIITVSASARTPESAADIANAIAEAGIEAYIAQQNSSVESQLIERNNQRDRINSDIADIDRQMQALSSVETGLPPDLEMDKLRSQISETTSAKNAVALRRASIEVRMQELHSVLKATPELVDFEVVEDNTSSMGIENKRSELATLRQRYTDENPKVRRLAEEITLLEAELAAKEGGGPPTKVIRRKSELHSRLEEQYTFSSLDFRSADAEMAQYDKEIERLRAQASKLTEVYNKHAILKNQRDIQRENLGRVIQGINETQFLLSSAVPDVSIVERASKAAAFSPGNSLIKVFGLSFFVAALFAAGMAAWEIARMRLLAAAEYPMCLGVENLGELPEAKDTSGSVRMSALQLVCRNLRTFSGNRRRLAFLKFDAIPFLDSEIDEILKFSALNGRRTFRVKLIPGVRPEAEEGSVDANDPVAGELISVVKTVDEGTFYYQNDYCLEIPERQLLNFDLEILAAHYDIITLEIVCGANSDYLASQLANLSDYVVLAARFRETKKLVLWRNLMQIRKVTSVKIGGLLTDIPLPYYKR